MSIGPCQHCSGQHFSSDCPKHSLAAMVARADERLRWLQDAKVDLANAIARAEAAESELARWKNATFSATPEDLSKSVADSLIEAVGLRAIAKALAEYVAHDEDCPDPNEPCNCRLAAVLAKLSALLAPTAEAKKGCPCGHVPIGPKCGHPGPDGMKCIIHANHDPPDFHGCGFGQVEQWWCVPGDPPTVST